MGGSDSVGDLLKETRKAIALFDGTLVVGNHDSITLLGTQSQNRLRDYSRAVSKLLLRDNDELDTAIEDVVSEIEKFENRAKNKTHKIFGINKRYKEFISEYRRIIAYIEQVCLFFQLQQAQLLKEIKLLEKLSITVHESTTALEECIKVGKEVISTRKVSDENNVKSHTQNFMSDDTEDDTWYSRLERRIDDLCISHAFALQNQAQIKILYDNNMLLLDRISTTISNTFPIWQNQMATMLGIQKLEQRIYNQNQVLGNAKDNSPSILWNGDILRKKPNIDIDGIMESNSKLRNALKEAASLEKQDLLIRKNFREAAHHIERG